MRHLRDAASGVIVRNAQCIKSIMFHNVNLCNLSQSDFAAGWAVFTGSKRTMIQQQIFVCGDGLLSHPVSYLFHLGEETPRGRPDGAALEKTRLILADCRTTEAAQTAEWVSQGLRADRPILLLCPSPDTLSALRGIVGILPQRSVAALLISASRNASGLTDFRVEALEYSAVAAGAAAADAPSRAALEHDRMPTDDPAVACACIDFASLGSAFVDPAAADLFKVHVERAMDRRHGSSIVLDNTPPTGLRYFLQTFTTTYSFTYSQGGTSNKGAGAATFTWTVWGFLNQTQQGNSQYLVVEGRISVNAGSLHANDECDRGFGNAYVLGTLTAPMSPQAFVPTSGSGSFSGTVSIPISYKSPTGGYQIWTYTGSISNTVDKWSCKSISSGASLGAQWWMTDPCDGSNIPDKWKDAFSTWGHVGDFSGATSGSLDVNTISSWVSNTLLTGYQSVSGSFGWEGVRFWGSSCSPGMYWKINAGWTWYSNYNPGFSVDFSPINP